LQAVAMSRKAPEPARHDIVVVGTSAGGMAALRQIVAGLPASFPGSLFVVMHLPADTLGSLPDFLNKAGPLPAADARDGEAIEPGRIYVAPQDRHLLLSDGALVRLGRGPKENRFRPAIDPLFRSAALCFGPRVVGVVLTGNLDDGTAGLAAIKRAGGIAIVQDPAEAEAPSMPRSALRHVAVDHCLRLAEIAPMLVGLATGSAAPGGKPRRGAVPKELEIETEIAAGTVDSSPRILELGEPSIFTCPECHGSLVRLRDRVPERFRCHTGHAYTAEGLDAALAETVENSLWSGVRALQEHAMLLNHLIDHAEDRELEANLRRRSMETLRRADLVRQALLSTLPVKATEPAQ
jgi:two-component system chemotaxis response regulator CheB